MKTLAAFLLVLAGCASAPTEERIYERENKLILAKEEFERRKEACQRAGGVMMIRRHGISRTRETAADYKFAQCVRF